MIKAGITKDGNVSLAALGNDVESIKSLPKNLTPVIKGNSLNFKTGRKHFVVVLEEASVEDNSEELKQLKNDLAAAKRELTKVKGKNKTLETEIKDLKAAASPEADTED